MKKKVKTIFQCDYCNRQFKNPVTCSEHEIKCKIKTQDIEQLTNYILCLVSHYHKKGYKIDIRYDDRWPDDLIVVLS